MTGDQIDAHVKNAMMNQQANLLKLTAENALELIQEQDKGSSTEILDKIDEEIDKSREHDRHNWQNPTNEKGYKKRRTGRKKQKKGKERHSAM